MSEEQSALFKHGRHGGVGGGVAWSRKPPFPDESPEKEECAGRAAAGLRRRPGSHVSAAPVHLKVASRQF